MTTHLIAIEHREVYDPPFGLVNEYWPVCECGWTSKILYATETDAETDGDDHRQDATADEMAAQADAAYDSHRDEQILKGWYG